MRPVVSYDDIANPDSNAPEQLGPPLPSANQPPAKKRKTYQKTPQRKSQHVQHWDDPGNSSHAMNYAEDVSLSAHHSAVQEHEDTIEDEENEENEESRDLTHEEIWDDSALIEAWNSANAEYEAYHGKGKDWKQESVKKSPLWYNVPPSSNKRQVQSHEETNGDVANVSTKEDVVDSMPINFDTYVPAHDPSLPSAVPAHPPTIPGPDYAQFYLPDPPGPIPTQDEAFSRALSAMYWGGYWTANGNVYFLCVRSSVLVDMGLFAVDLLQTQAGLDVALQRFAAWQQQPTETFCLFLGHMINTVGLIPFILSNLSGPSLEVFSGHLSQMLPDCITSDYETHITYRLIVHFADFWAAQCITLDDVTRAVGHATSILHSRTAVLDSLRTVRSTDMHAPLLVPKFPTHPFEDLGLSPPIDMHEVKEMAAKMFEDLREILKYYLDLVQDDRLRQTIHESFLRTDEMSASGLQADEHQIVVADKQITLSNKNRSLLFNNVAGFGETPLLGSPRLIKNLKTARSHPSLFRAIMNKLRTLSEGHCDGSESIISTKECDVPVYAARISKHCVLVYYRTYEDIRVFGIYATAALDTGFWRAVGESLVKSGENRGHEATQRKPSSAEYDDQIRKLVVPQEKEVVKHSGSCYVYGRSGTGKTTIILYKILAGETSWAEHPDLTDSVKPRQLFVTRSKLLAQKVEKEFEQLFEARIFEGDSGKEVTRSTTFPPSLPAKFEELLDEDFPLFVSYEQLCLLLEAQFGIQYSSTSRRGCPKRNESPLSYETFLSQYWYTFPKVLTGRLDPSLVFAEFVGTIEGSEKTHDSPLGYLSKDEYLSSASNYADSPRLQEKVYELFQLYLKRKSNLGHHDRAERAHALLKVLNGCAVDFLIWQTRGQVHVVESNGLDLGQFASSSAKEEWAKAGHDFFDRGSFSHAKQAYDNAGLEYLASKAEAYRLREAARLLPAVMTRGRTTSLRALAFSNAADAFLAIAPDGGSQTPSFYHEAAACLLEVPNKERAAEVYSLVGDHTEAAVIFREHNLFDKAVEEVNNHLDHVPPEVVNRIRYAASLAYFRNSQMTKGRKLFNSEESCTSFVETYGFSRAHVLLLKGQNRMVEAVTRLISLRNGSKAVELFMKVRSQMSAEDRLKILHFTLKMAQQSIVLNIPFVSIPSRRKHDFEHASALVELIRAIGTDNDLYGIEALERKMFLWLNSTDGAVNSTIISSSEAAELPDALAIIHLETSLDVFPHLAQLKTADMAADWLLPYLRYAVLLRRVILDGDPLDNRCIQRLLGFEQTSHQTFRLLHDGPMHTLGSLKQVHVELHTDCGDMLITRAVARRTKLVETCIAVAFQERILDATDKTLASRWLQTQERASGTKEDGSGLGSEPLAARMQLVLRCVLLLDCLRGLKNYRTDLESRKRVWLVKLYELVTRPECNPSLYPLVNWLRSCDAQCRRAIAVIGIWIRDARTPCGTQDQDFRFKLSVDAVLQ
ncbi:hypothetical protein EIP86_006386 [Pleurotus ostreatoroseus]|nr:hypothetical protein EIP86_006386 [Pleurotus ostreatoroseus]